MANVDPECETTEPMPTCRFFTVSGVYCLKLMFQFICSLKMFTGTPTDVVIKRNLEVVDEEMKLEVN